MQIDENDTRIWQKLSLAGVFLYALIFLFFFWQTPLGMTPVLDGAENIRLAEEIFQGTLPKEPFYRAILYPVSLSIFRFIGFSNQELPALASILGLFLHLLNAWLVGVLANQIWKNDRAMTFAILLYGFYPPALHFAVDPLDVTMSLSFLLAAAVFYEAEPESEIIGFNRVWSGTFLGLGVLIRANLFPIVGVWLFQLFFKKSRLGAAIAILSFSIPILVFAGINFYRSGEFRILPWQGAFNFYAANCRHANGKYFQQQLMVADRELGKNPARLESEIIFARASGKKPPFSITEFNSFWIDRTFEDIKQDPFRWLRLIAMKSYFLLNNFEQYNNKTFIFHKELSPVLRYNPLCFGLILLFAVLAVVNGRSSAKLLFLIKSIIFFSLGMIAFYASARFRIIIVPFIAATASGAILLTKAEVLAKRSLLAVFFTSILCFSAFAGVADLTTLNADRLLMAHASARLGLYDQQMSWSEKVLQENPNDIQAIRLKLNAFANLVLSGHYQEEGAWMLVKPQLEMLQAQKLVFIDTIFIQGCYLYSCVGQPAIAISLWEKGLEISPQKDLFLAALLAAGKRTADSEIKNLAEKSPLLWYILAHKGFIDEKNEIRYKNNAAVAKILFKM